MDKVLEQLSWSRLPVPEPGVFSGDILKFPGWITSFNALVDRRSIPADEKLFYLKKYLSGEAREAVEGHFILGYRVCLCTGAGIFTEEIWRYF